MKSHLEGNDLYIYPENEKYDSVLIWMHGLGDTPMGY